MSKMPLVDDFDDIPELTDEMLARARPAAEVHGAEFAALLVRPRGRPAKAPEELKQKVNLRLSPEVLAALRSTGAGWQRRADEALRKAFVK
ncbi:BrnA antitoxin family protein [Novosphingobium sp. B 225]|uniref:BrnA antitoxin family protein n=1 Tax=Novosphingobium sp. B 225 TaxID=1961849 RepID=UPI000B4AFA24|nr:BrnA antitoxin family protein [Novosphingobium sp. B 225]